MPTKRRQNTPGKVPTSSRGGRSSARSHARTGSARTSSRHSTRQGFSTSAPRSSSKSTFLPNASFAGGSSRDYATSSSPTPNGGLTPEVLLTRRNLLIGAAAVGGIAAVGGGVSLASDALGGSDEGGIDYISVPSDSVVNSSDFTEVDASTYVTLTGSFQLAYGTLVWADNDIVAACLVPTEEASPLTTVSLLYLTTGNTVSVLSAAQGADEGYEIFDVRCSEQGMIWTEADTYDSTWRVYTASISNASLANITLVDEGDSNWLMPSLAAVDNRAFWQVVPNSDGENADDRSLLKAATFGGGSAEEVYSSKRAFATRLAAASDGVVITPRADSTSVYYQLTKISASDCSTVDQMTLPSSMTPDVVGYGESGFSFGFTSIYSYGDGIANLGTYTPRAAVTPYNYNDLPWFRFSRTPVTEPCWCGDWYVVKSTTALVGANFATQTYFAIDTISGCDDYGEHLVSSGSCSSFVGLSQVTADDDSSEDYAAVRVFTPISSATESAF